MFYGLNIKTYSTVLKYCVVQDAVLTFHTQMESLCIEEELK